MYTQNSFNVSEEIFIYIYLGFRLLLILIFREFHCVMGVGIYNGENGKKKQENGREEGMRERVMLNTL